MSGAFTPGPWTAEESEVFDGDGWCLAETRPTRGAENGYSPEELANAHLIAAAPDLLEVGQALVRWLRLGPPLIPAPRSDGQLAEEYGSDVAVKVIELEAALKATGDAG